MIKSSLLLVACAASCAASPFILCSTGEVTATVAGCGTAINSPAANNLLPDGNWYVSSNSSGTFQSQAYVTINNSIPLQAAGPWLANDSSSAWITPTNNQNGQFINGTQIFYSSQFTLTAAQASSAVVSGSWLADDYGTGVFLNGIEVAQSSLPLFGSTGGPMVPFTITGGFTTGQNVITFGFKNDATNGGTITNPATGPTGARILITQAASGVTPEPATFGILAAGICAMVLARRVGNFIRVPQQK